VGIHRPQQLPSRFPWVPGASPGTNEQGNNILPPLQPLGLAKGAELFDADGVLSMQL
jgi:hypothetical protein